MPSVRSGRDEPEDDEDTPKTRSYVDALLQGNLSPDELESLRNGISGPPNLQPPAPPRTQVPSRLPVPPSTVPPVSQQVRGTTHPPLGGSHPPSAPAPPSWPGARSYGPPAVSHAAPRPYASSGDSDNQLTAVRPYVPSEDTDNQPTAMRSYVPSEDTDNQPTAMRSYLPPVLADTRAGPAWSNARARSEWSDTRARSEWPDRDETEQRTSRRVYGAPAAPAPSSYVPSEDSDNQPTAMRSYVPPEEDDGIGEGDRTSVHTYTMEEISGLGDLGDLDVPGARESSVPPPPSSEDGEAYLAAIGGLGVVPRLVLPHGRVTDLPLGVQAAFVLSRIDGVSSVEDILDISGLSRLTTLRILHELMQKGLLRVGGGRG